MSEWIKCDFSNKDTTPFLGEQYLIYLPNQIPNIFFAEFSVRMRKNIKAFLYCTENERHLIKAEGIYYMPIPKPPETEG